MTSSTLPSPEAMFAALRDRDASFEGLFIAAIRTTGIFCRPGCPARTPLFENVAFFPSTTGSLPSGYRPCKRCKPIAPKGVAPEWRAGLL